VYCAQEGRPTAGLKIVPALYAKTWCDESAVRFDEHDHITLVKPANVEDAVYRWVKARMLKSGRRMGGVLWDGGERLGVLVRRLQDGYRERLIPETVRFTDRSDLLAQLWIEPGTYRAGSWGELFESVAIEYRCLGVRVIRPGAEVELFSKGPVRRMSNGSSSCAL
jgi:hypothetical protein